MTLAHNASLFILNGYNQQQQKKRRNKRMILLLAGEWHRPCKSIGGPEERKSTYRSFREPEWGRSKIIRNSTHPWGAQANQFSFFWRKFCVCECLCVRVCAKLHFQKRYCYFQLYCMPRATIQWRLWKTAYRMIKTGLFVNKFCVIFWSNDYVSVVNKRSLVLFFFLIAFFQY